jgi:hypothetical protein
MPEDPETEFGRTIPAYVKGDAVRRSKGAATPVTAVSRVKTTISAVQVVESAT